MAENVKIGLQLYTVRDHGEKDYPEMLKKVKSIGYDYVELAGHDAYSAGQLNGWLADAGLTALSAHCSLENFEESIEKTVEKYSELNVKYLAIPWMSREKNPGGPEFEATLPKLKAYAKACAEAGMQLLYHNHDFEFELVGGVPALDLLYEALPEILPEFDTCWVRYAGFDPVKYINKFAGKTPVIHLKDFVGEKTDTPVYALINKEGKGEGGQGADTKAFAFRPVGQGVQDIPAIMRAGIASGAKAYIVEQDECYGDTLAAARASLEYLKSIGF